MVELYGAIHGMHWDDFFTGRHGDIEISPSKELLNDLQRFPAGTRVGIESLNKEDGERVESHLLKLPFNPPATRFINENYGVPIPASRPIYIRESNSYWDILAKECSKLKFDVVFLENKNIWFKYNQARIKQAENNQNRENLFVFEKGESKEHYNRKVVSFNLERYKEETLIRKIHEIERDNELLKAIKLHNVNIAFVGEGHASYWAANSEKIYSEFGIKIENYSRESPVDNRVHYPYYKVQTIFDKQALPDEKVTSYRQNLERTIKLLEQKRLGDKEPDFIGTWDIRNPLKGYFEMFVNKNGGKIQGEIIDCLGDADFEGKVDARNIKFVKQYRERKNEIDYQGIVRDGKIIGFFTTEGFGEPFYATSKKPKNLVELGVSWDLLAERYKKGVNSIGKRLFDKKAN